MVSLRKTMAVIRQSRFFFAVAPAMAIPSAFIAVKNYNLTQLFLIVLSFILIWSFMSSVNNTYDIETDQHSQLMKTQNPIVTGELSLRETRVMNIVLPILSIAVGILVGPYWIGLPLLTIILVVLYDIKPFRFKDTPLGFLIAPISQCLPFIFSYTTAAAGFTLPAWVLCVFTFLYFNGVVVTRFLPDSEVDLKLKIHNFSATYGAEAARRVDIASTIIMGTTLIAGMLLGGLSFIGLPLLLISITMQLRILAQGVEVLKNPMVFRRFALGMIPNSVSMVLSVVGSVR